MARMGQDQGQRLRLAPSFCGLGRILSWRSRSPKLHTPCGWCHLYSSMNKVQGFGCECPPPPSWLPLSPGMGTHFLEKLSQAARALCEFLVESLHFHFSGDGANAQRDAIICPGSHSKFLGGPPLRALLSGTGSQQPGWNSTGCCG